MFKVLILVGLLTQNIYQSNAAAACTNGELYPHESECSKFYQCDNGKLVLRLCAAPLEFSTNINICTYADESGCELNKGNAGENNNGGDKPCDPTTPKPCDTTTTPSPPPCETTTTPKPCETTEPTTTTPKPSPTTEPTTPTPKPTTPSPCDTTTKACDQSPSTPPPPPPCTDPPVVHIQNPYPECPVVADPNKDVLKPLPKCCQFVHCTNYGVGVVKNCAPSNPPLVFSPCENRCVWPWEAGNITCDPCTC